MKERLLLAGSALFALSTAWAAAVSLHADIPSRPLGLHLRGSTREQLVRGLGTGLSAPWPMVAMTTTEALLAGRARRPGLVSVAVGCALLARTMAQPVTWRRHHRSRWIESALIMNLASGAVLICAGRRALGSHDRV